MQSSSVAWQTESKLWVTLTWLERRCFETCLLSTKQL